MTCYQHPHRMAVGNCASCGCTVCEECMVNINNQPHCRTCVEAGRIGGAPGQAAPQPKPAADEQTILEDTYSNFPAYHVYLNHGREFKRSFFRIFNVRPRPKSIPNRRIFLVGSGGSVSAGIAAMIMSIIFFPSSNIDINDLWLSYLWMACPVIFMVAVIPFAIGLYGFYRNYGSVWGLVGSAGFSVCAVLFAIMIYFSVFEGRLYVDEPDPYFNPDMDYYIIGQIIAGIGCLLASIAILQGKNYFSPEQQVSGLAQASAFCIFLAGILLMVILGSFVGGWAILGASLVLMSIVFYDARLPRPEKVEGAAD